MVDSTNSAWTSINDKHLFKLLHGLRYLLHISQIQGVIESFNYTGHGFVYGLHIALCVEAGYHCVEARRETKLIKLLRYLSFRRQILIFNILLFWNDNSCNGSGGSSVIVWPDVVGNTSISIATYCIFFGSWSTLDPLAPPGFVILLLRSTAIRLLSMSNPTCWGELAGIWGDHLEDTDSGMVDIMEVVEEEEEGGDGGDGSDDRLIMLVSFEWISPSVLSLRQRRCHDQNESCGLFILCPFIGQAIHVRIVAIVISEQALDLWDGA